MPWWPRQVARAGLVSGLLLISGNFSLAQSLVQQAYLKATNPVGGDNFGKVLAISGDTAVVGVPGENSSTGAAYVFVRTGSTWAFQAKLQPSNLDATDEFGFSVAISGDTIVVGARSEDSSTTGANSTSNNSASNAGAAYVFVRNGTSWSQQAYLKASNPGVDDRFGSSVAISDQTIVVGAPREDSDAKTINGGTGNATAGSNFGAAYVFVRNGTSWGQQAYLKASNTNSYDYFGDGVAIHGGTVVVGASGRYRDWETHTRDRKSTRLNSSHSAKSRMPSSA